MTAKMKQEALCCQDLSVRCARAELERDAAKKDADASDRWAKQVAEAYDRQEMRTSEARIANEKLVLENERLKNERWRVHMDARERADAFVETRLSAHYGEMGLGEALFFLCWASGVAAWIWFGIKLVVFVAGRLA